MLLVDVNVLVCSYREDAPGRRRYREWLEELVNFDDSYGIADLVLGGFLRAVMHPDAARLAEQRRDRARPPDTRLCGEAAARGNLVPAAYLAALSPADRRQTSRRYRLHTLSASTTITQKAAQARNAAAGGSATRNGLPARAGPTLLAAATTEAGSSA
jgi:predicted nucleic acid-binding protein